MGDPTKGRSGQEAVVGAYGVLEPHGLRYRGGPEPGALRRVDEGGGADPEIDPPP